MAPRHTSMKLYEYADDGQAISHMLRMKRGGFNNDLSDYGRPRGAEGRHWDSKQKYTCSDPSTTSSKAYVGGFIMRGHQHV